MSVPLDKQNVVIDSNKSKETFPALHQRWVEEVQFVSYQAPPTDLTDKGQYEEWLERLKFIEADIHWLLQLPHAKFWCQAIFDSSLHRCLDSYLRFAPRSYETIHKLPSAAKETHDEVHRLIFLSCLRMATYKESKECYITPSVFGEILYENFLFDIPKMLDLCVLYGAGNKQLLARMIDNIFTQQPGYHQDLADTINTLSQVFDNITTKCGIQVESGSQSPQKLGELGTKKASLLTMSTAEFRDIIFYLSDIGVTLTSFLDVFPEACQAFHDSDFLVRLPGFYDAVVPEVFAALKQRELNIGDKKELKKKLLEGRTHLLTVFQTVIAHCCIQPLLEKTGVTMDYVEDYLHLMSTVLNDRRFLADYESVLSFQGDLDILMQASGDVDETRIQYIKEAVNIAFATYGKRKAPKGAMNRGGRKSPDGSVGPLEGATGGATAAVQPGAYQVEDHDSGASSAPAVTGVQLDSLISSIKDLLPELGEGFIELCLEELNYDMERVINAMLEDNPPPSLREVDRLLPRKKRAPSPPSLLHERKNIYDYDEFDVFHRDDIDKQKIRHGKAEKTENIVIGDKTALREINDNISKDYGVVVDIVEERVPPAQPPISADTGEGEYTRDLYEDEYDDTYDTNVVGADDADSADELTNLRPFTVPRVLGGAMVSRAKVNYENDSEESEEESPGKKKDLFIEDPAKIRERAEDRARWKANRRGQGYQGQQSQGQGQPAQGQAKKTHDVKGGPKGQGQSKEVQRNRKWKTEHKGDFRRAQADRKRKV
ncbi:activating signal cointegrator 1 complex subunit 2-like [Mya arenaria]|uniref:activating signal cointegrator 1 complex subunit 2-like n=1 Tax=Mya arenaria TaxID=6604 RepID=UPI0022E34A97|nr:activating signal cointegrator 1 complex subunit 2-like [Mya arenaria]